MYMSHIFRKDCVTQTSGERDAGWNVPMGWVTMVQLSACCHRFRTRRWRSGNGHVLARGELVTELLLGVEPAQEAAKWSSCLVTSYFCDYAVYGTNKFCYNYET